MNEGILKFICAITGHDEETIKQMFNDWLKSPSSQSDQASDDGVGCVVMCRKCKTKMMDGIALQNTVVKGTPDFEGQEDLTGQTLHYGGNGKIINVLKCSNCGHSISKGT